MSYIFRMISRWLYVACGLVSSRYHRCVVSRWPREDLRRTDLVRVQCGTLCIPSTARRPHDLLLRQRWCYLLARTRLGNVDSGAQSTPRCTPDRPKAGKHHGERHCLPAPWDSPISSRGGLRGGAAAQWGVAPRPESAEIIRSAGCRDTQETRAAIKSNEFCWTYKCSRIVPGASYDKHHSDRHTDQSGGKAVFKSKTRRTNNVNTRV